MVVVAIIGILAVIGIPQYQKFTAKARQAEAKAHLSAIYLGLTSFHVEYSIYTTSMKNIAYLPLGQNLRYNAGFDTIVCPGVSPMAPPNGTAADNDIVSRAAAEGAAVNWFYPSIADPAITSCDSTQFVAGAWGNPKNNSVAGENADQFTIDQNKRLIHLSVGL